jgi:hypothetical protein
MIFSCNTTTHTFSSVPELMLLFLTGEDQSQADQPNCLAEGVNLNLSIQATEHRGPALQHQKIAGAAHWQSM